DSIKVYNTCVDAGPCSDWARAMEDPAGLAEDLASEGFLGMKLWPFDRYAPAFEVQAAAGPAGAGSMGLVGSYLSPRQLAEGLSVFERARDRVGDRLELLVEGHSRWDLNMAIRIARAVEPLGVLWMEDICQPESARDLGRLVRETSVPQAVSERLISRFPFRQVLEEQAAHVVMLDLGWTGGLSEARRIAELAAAYHLPFAPHDCTGPVTATANLHLALAMPNCVTTEVVRGFVRGYYEEVLDRPLQLRDGSLTLATRPGLGTGLRPELLASPTVTVRRSS
ncbi:MAG TPA: mandelate racemase/muconate lactonizing enzyme family protein, partial [Acidimicrobiales bacterium]|nr:mandelate racemase/muconate lactonizing enzyme family protein [Acidimicrobiales bacterium]